MAIRKTFISLILFSPLPGLMFLTYGLLRIFSIQPPVESGMSEFMTTGFFLAGSTVCYFMMGTFGAFRDAKGYLRWFAASALMLLLALDESFMFHDQINYHFSIPENAVFAVYGVFLVGVLILFRRSCSHFWIALCGFVLFCGIAQIADTLFGEGVIFVFGREVDYEQIFEAVGALCLAFAFSFQAFRVIVDGGFSLSRQSQAIESAA